MLYLRCAAVIDPVQGSVLTQSRRWIYPDRDQRQRHALIALTAGSIALFLARATCVWCSAG